MGNADIDNVRIGSSQVDKIYLGASLVWTRGTPPVFSLGGAAFTLGGRINFNLNTRVTGTQPITLTATGLPPGLRLVSGVIVGIPSRRGTYRITVTATNSAGTTQGMMNVSVINPVLI